MVDRQVSHQTDRYTLLCYIQQHCKSLARLWLNKCYDCYLCKRRSWYMSCLGDLCSKLSEVGQCSHAFKLKRKIFTKLTRSARGESVEDRKLEMWTHAMGQRSVPNIRWESVDLSKSSYFEYLLSWVSSKYCFIKEQPSKGRRFSPWADLLVLNLLLLSAPHSHIKLIISFAYLTHLWVFVR